MSIKLADLGAKQKESPTNSFYLSLSDLMTLLCVFFVMILGISRIEVGSFEKVRTGITGNTSGTLVELANDLQKIAADKTGVSVRLADDGVRLDLESAALFDTGSAVLKPGSLLGLEPVLHKIRTTKYNIDVEGHTDDVPLFKQQGDDLETNWSLSGRRASSLVNYLIGMGFSEQHLRIVGYAANRPKAPVEGKDGGALERARQENRRVSILVH